MVTDVVSEDEGALAGVRVGKGIVVTGWALVNHVGDTPLVRYRAGGGLDKTLGGGDGKRILDMGGGLYDEGRGIVSAGGGKVVVASLVQGATDDVGMARFKKGGGLDPTFRGGGFFVEDFGADDRVGHLTRQGKKLVVGGDSDGTAAFRFKEKCNRENPFGENGRARLASGPTGTAVVVMRGRIVVAGHGSGSGVPLDFAVVAFRS